ncbi:MAG: M20/M25/M40 family metallo-hydrolase [Nitrospinae bacterium]|nr:M20/M25/M40 family metallo-hydrolase [Nitrospinota bacterium]
MADQDTEYNVLQHIDRGELVDLGKSLIRIPSFIGEETPAARWLASYFAARGYEVELQEVEPGWFQTVAVLKGAGQGRSLMFNGHLDINPLASGWTRHPFDPWVEGDKLYGAGIRNMKSGVAAMIHAAEAIRKSGLRLAGDLIIACVVAELQGGLGTKYLLDKGYRPDVAVVTEPYGAHHVVTKHAGMSNFSLHVTGKHPAGDDVRGVDAILQMIKAINAIYTTQFTHQPWDVPGLPWLKIGSLIGGRGETYDLRSVSRNADLCTAFIAVSTVPGMTAETIRVDLEGTLTQLKQQDPGFTYRLVHPIERKFKTWILDHPPMDMPVDEAIVRTLVASYQKITGQKPKSVGLPASELNARYGDDDAHLWEAGIPSPIYGPAGGSYGEDFAYIEEMVLCSQVLALTALAICA